MTTTLTFNKENWTGETGTANVNEAKKTFSFNGYDFTYEVADIVEGAYRFQTVTVYLEDREHAIVKVMKDGKRPPFAPTRFDSKSWMAIQSDAIEGVVREDADPIVAACKVIANIL